MQQNKAVEKQFKRIYNRDLEVYQKYHKKDGIPSKTDTKIIYKDKEFLLTEYLNKDGKTACSTLEHEGKKWKHKTHLEAEFHCMYLAGGYDGKS